MISLFTPELPDGFLYREQLLTRDEENDLVHAISAIEFDSFQMRGVVARRRVKFFGASYHDGPTSPLPDFMLALRVRLARWADVPPEAFAMALINEYTTGAAIGWHRDAPQYDIIAGVSLLSACRMKLRPYVAPKDLSGSGPGARRMTTHEIRLEPRSGYLITGLARSGFEHSIRPIQTRRYSVTFRTLRRSVRQP